MASETKIDSHDRTVNPDGDGGSSMWPFVLPLIVYMLVASRFPTLTPESVDDVAVNNYLSLVVAQVVMVSALLFFVRSRVREFPFRIDIWAVVVGVVGVALWVGVCALKIEQQTLGLVGLGEWLPERAGFNPFAQITDPSKRLAFLLFRFTGLALLVPVVEELFLRGFFVRYVEHPEGWNKIKLSSIGVPGIAAVAMYAVATHPGEAIAAVLWFTMVSILMVKTGKFWNCVLAHAITNLLLGMYVICFGQWQLW